MSWASLTSSRRRRPGLSTLMARTTNGRMLTLSLVIRRARRASISTKERGVTREYAESSRIPPVRRRAGTCPGRCCCSSGCAGSACVSRRARRDPFSRRPPQRRFRAAQARLGWDELLTPQQGRDASAQRELDQAFEARKRRIRVARRNLGSSDQHPNVSQQKCGGAPSEPGPHC